MEVLIDILRREQQAGNEVEALDRRIQRAKRPETIQELEILKETKKQERHVICDELRDWLEEFFKGNK